MNTLLKVAFDGDMNLLINSMQLLNVSSNKNDEYPISKLNPLFKAAFDGDMNLVKSLLKNTDINLVDSLGFTALFLQFPKTT